MSPNKYVTYLLKHQGKQEAKRVAEAALKTASTDAFWIEVNNLLKKVK